MNNRIKGLVLLVSSTLEKQICQTIDIRLVFQKSTSVINKDTDLSLIPIIGRLQFQPVFVLLFNRFRVFDTYSIQDNFSGTNWICEQQEKDDAYFFSSQEHIRQSEQEALCHHFCPIVNVMKNKKFIITVLEPLLFFE